MTKPEAKPVLRSDRLYLGDNGRAFCGALRCAGMSSHFTGRDLSGQKVYKVTREDLAAFKAETGHMIRCESCGWSFLEKENA